jgi:methionyl-tRNA formyltransferase
MSDDDALKLASLPTAPVRRLAFLGTPEIAADVLSSLVDSGFEIALVVTRVDKRRGRGSGLMPSPVKEVAVRHGIRVEHDVESLLEEHRRHPIDIAVVVAFGAIVKPHVLAEIPMVNLHVSLLPRWRGAAPVERAILAGDAETGVCLMRLEEGLDTGAVIASSRLPIDPTSTAEDILDQLGRVGTRLLIEALHSGSFPLHVQRGEPSYAAKIEPHERHIDWNESAEMVSRRVRIGGAWTEFRSKRLKIHAVEVVEALVDSGTIHLMGDRVIVGCSDRAVLLREVQPDGRPRLGAVAWARGARLLDGEPIGEHPIREPLRP